MDKKYRNKIANEVVFTKECWIYILMRGFKKMTSM